MACLYVTEQGANLRAVDGKFVVECKDGKTKSVPIETLESVMVFGGGQMSLQAHRECLKRDIKVVFLLPTGKYAGKLEGASSGNALRIKKQIYLSDNEEQCLVLSKKILEAKINNQMVLVKRYARTSKADVSDEVKLMSAFRKNVGKTKDIEAAMGCEGMAAKEYFKALSKMIKKDFAFDGRSKRPPKDAFNAMISLGYTILSNEIYAEIEAKSLSPFVGFMHKLKSQHAALASDLLEEWRATIVDAVVFSMIQGNEISIDEFRVDPDGEGVWMSKEGKKKLITKLEKKMHTESDYLSYIDGKMDFRQAVWHQIKTIASCVESGDFEEYCPIRLR